MTQELDTTTTQPTDQVIRVIPAEKTIPQMPEPRQPLTHTHTPQHKVRAGGQLLPLTKRMTEDQMVQREAKMAYRRSISREHGMTRGLAFHGFALRNQGFFGRFLWLFTGRIIVPNSMKAD